MRIALVTAGAGGMYCGSCLRDNVLAAELLAGGHEVLLIPVYTPTRTDEPNLSEKRVFLGGINVYLQQHSSLFRFTPWFVDRALDWLPLLKLATRWGIEVDAVNLGELTVSMLRGDAGFQSKEIRKLAKFLKDTAPDIINLPNSLLLGLAPELKAQVRAPICCTLQGEDLFLQRLAEPYASEATRLIRSHAVYVDAFLAVSGYSAEVMSGYLGIGRDKIDVVPLGIHLDGYGRPEAGPETFTIGYFARIAPEKGLHLLCDAYRALRRRTGLPPSRIAAAGYLAPEHKPYLEEIQRKMKSWGFGDEFHYAGDLDRKQKIAFLQSLSVLSVPSPYAEPKGLYLLEAMACGVPVIQPRKGAFPELIEKTGGGLLVEPDTPEALADAIYPLWQDPERRSELGRRGMEGVRAHFSATLMAERTLQVYRRIGVRT